MRPLAALLLILTLSGCDGMARIFGADMPVGFVRFTPGSDYLPWWRQIEECSGRRASIHGVEWFFYPGQSVIPGTDAPAQRRSPGNDVFFADTAAGMVLREDRVTVQHEMMHVITGEGGHRTVWRERCGHLVTTWSD